MCGRRWQPDPSGIARMWIPWGNDLMPKSGTAVRIGGQIMTHYAVLWTCTYNTYEKVTEIGVIKLCFKQRYISLPQFPFSLFLHSPHLFRIPNRSTEISCVTTNIPNHSEKPHVIKVGSKTVALDVHFCLAFSLNHLQFESKQHVSEMFTGRAG